MPDSQLPGNNMSSRRSLQYLAVLLVTSVTSFGAIGEILNGGGYVPQPNDIFVPADAGVCCTGEAPGLTNDYVPPLSLRIG